MKTKLALISNYQIEIEWIEHGFRHEESITLDVFSSLGQIIKSDSLNYQHILIDEQFNDYYDFPEGNMKFVEWLKTKSTEIDVFIISKNLTLLDVLNDIKNTLIQKKILLRLL